LSKSNEGRGSHGPRNAPKDKLGRVAKKKKKKGNGMNCGIEQRLIQAVGHISGKESKERREQGGVYEKSWGEEV